jgi:aryl-alcohol dehydrogenase-like predicted oxidoreductase
VIGLGTNRFGTDAVPQQGVHTIMDAAEDLGTNFVDTADIYVKGRSEEMRRGFDDLIPMGKVIFSES